MPFENVSPEVQAAFAEHFRVLQFAKFGSPEHEEALRTWLWIDEDGNLRRTVRD